MTLLDWLASSGNKIQKKKRLENVLAHANLWRGSTQIECSSQKMAQPVRKYRTEIQTYKVEERTIGTPCISI